MIIIALVFLSIGYLYLKKEKLARNLPKEVKKDIRII